MNAYELADKLDWVCENHLVAIGDADFKATANMLRLQADELTEAGGVIGVLREYISDLENGLDSSIKLNKAQAERQVKELTDDEIVELIIPRKQQILDILFEKGWLDDYR